MSTVVTPRVSGATSATTVRSPRRSLRDGLRRFAEAAVTPLELDDVLDVFHPLRAGAELRGKIVSVHPETDQSATLRDQAREGLGRARAGSVRPDRRRRRRRPPLAHLLPHARPPSRPLHQHHGQGDPRRRGLQPPGPPGPSRPDGAARAGRGRLRPLRPDAGQAAAGHRGLGHHPGDRDAAQPVLARRAGAGRHRAAALGAVAVRGDLRRGAATVRRRGPAPAGRAARPTSTGCSTWPTWTRSCPTSTSARRTPAGRSGSSTRWRSTTRRAACRCTSSGSARR